VELVTDRRTKAPVAGREMQSLVDFCRDEGVIVGRSTGTRHLANCVVLAPPLVFTRREIDRVVTVLDRAISRLGRELAAA
jgi:adenosylmethionine-8-amino-7-oxononanoate aminotransferase